MSRHYRQPGISFPDGTATALLWAPNATSVSLQRADDGTLIPLSPSERGWWCAQTASLQPGDRYWFVLDEKKELPDPASLKQPEGVHGPSEAVDLRRIAPADEGWAGILLEDYIIYELHTGTFSGEGTFAGVKSKIQMLKDLGVNAIEIMPVAAFPGNRNWGYDGVFPFAAHAGYGGPEGLADLVSAAHAAGMAVILDVVYNHLGPEGNYFGEFGPYITEKYNTPWGGAINFDDAGCDAVRDYFIANALMWLRDFHIDALRLDAVHAIRDFSAKHILLELREAVDALEAETGRDYHLIVESDLNDPRFIRMPAIGGFGMDAQWIDEFHHALRVCSGQPRSGYYSDFDGLDHLAKSYRDAYIYDGQYSPHRDKRFGAPATGAPGQQFIVFSQNHDQVGNRMLGERTSILLSFEMQKLLAAAVLLSPFIPLLFMGEEWAEPAPFQYFISHTDPELVEAVRKGRREEFNAFHAAGEAPDPQSGETFMRCRLDWELINQEPHSSMLRFYKALIRLRRTHPALRPDRSATEAAADKARQLLVLKRGSGPKRLLCLLNFSDAVQAEMLPANARLLLNSAAAEWGGRETGSPAPTPSIAQIQPAACLIYEYDV